MGRKRDWRVCLIGKRRDPEGEVVMWWDGWEGIRVRARNWELRRERWSFMGRTWVKMTYVSRLHASRDYPEGMVLEGLNFSY